MIFNNTDGVASRECTPTDVFSVPSTYTVDIDLSNAPLPVAQSVLAINANWVDPNVRNVHVSWLNSDGSFYQHLSFSSGAFQVNNAVGNLLQERNAEALTLMISQKDCADITSTPIN